VPTVTRFAVTDGSYVDTNDTAADTAGSQTIVLYGSGFAPGATVLVGSTTIGAVTFLDSGRLTFSSPALGSGSYTIFVTNANGGTGILVPGLVYSGVPTFTTSAGSLGSVYETTAISTTVVATGDAPITYAISSGSLPTGSTLSSSGTISGTAPVDGSSTTYSFTVQATDAQNQDSVRSFSLTINTDVVSFSSPANNTSYSVSQNSPISNVTPAATSAAGYGVLYTSSGLPTGLSMDTSTGIISGTPTIVASNTSIITATANTTTRTAALYLNWTINLPGDAFWNYASLLMSANSAPNGNTFNTDASTFNNEIVVSADTKPNEFHPFKEGYYSNFLDGTGDYLAILTSSAFNIATNSFTVEAWINTSSATQQTIFNISDTGSTGYGAVRVQVLANQTVQWLMGPGGSWGVAVTAGSIVLGAWNHIAITRNGSSVYFFVNGLQVSTTQTYATSLTTGGTTYIGYNSGTAYGFNGYISNFRFVNGTALYTANTTLSTAPLTYVANTSLLTCQSNKLIDNSNNNFTITKGGDTKVNPFNPFNGTPTTITVPGANNYSVYFDGTGDYLTTPVNAGFDMGTGDFTVECFVINNGYSGSQYGRGIFTIYTSGSYTNRIMVRLSSGDNAINIYTNSGSAGTYFGTSGTNGTTQLSNSRQWYHIALVRQSGVFKLYINGVQDIIVSNQTSVSLPSSSLIEIGRNQDGSIPDWNGYISNFRVVKGTAVYTTTFSPPTAPLTAIANTSLLTAQANTIIDNSSNALTITTNGNAGPARNGPFANTTTVTLVGNEGSTYFDGAGDCLGAESSNGILPADFTVEMWVYLTSSIANQPLVAFGTEVSGRFSLLTNASGQLKYAVYGDATEYTYTTIAMVLNTWTHVAFSRTGTNMYAFINGALAGAVRTLSGSRGNGTRISVGAAAARDNSMTGYLSNVRVVNGTGLYTTPFVPSFAPLTPVANTVLLTAQTNLSSNTKVIVDESNLNNIVSGFGNSNLGTFSPFGSSRSVYFDGTGDYLDVPSNAVFTLGTGNFTIEGWMYMNSVTTGTLYDSRTGVSSVSPVIYLTSGVLAYYVAGSNVITGPTLLTGQWYHIAVVRNSGSTKMYLNGTQTGSTYTDSNNYVIGGPKIGAGYSNANLLTGYISNLRVVKGTAVYTANTTAPTTPLVSVANTVLLTCNSNQFVDYAAANNVITKNGDAAVSEFSPFSSVTVTPASYSGYFDGNGDYLSIAHNTALNLSSGDFTIEAWVLNTVNTAGATIIQKDGVSGSTYYSYNLSFNASGYVIFGVGSGNSTAYLQSIGGTTSLTVNTWYHIAGVKSGTTLSLYINGILNATATQTGTIVDGGKATLVGYQTGQPTAAYWSGYISNARIVKGTALYTTTFTPSTTPLTAVANTSLLTCQSTTFVDTSNNAFAITVNGNAKPVIQNPFTDTVSTASNYSANTFGNSVYFDGTADYLNVTPATALAFGTSDFTVEAWAYLPNVTSQQSIVYLNGNTSGYAALNLQVQSGALNLWMSSTGSAWSLQQGTIGSISANTWTHIAVTKSSTTMKVYINGTQAGTNYSVASSLMATYTLNQIGVYNNSSYLLTGYLSNLRVVMGTALYTGPFIPSGQPLPVTSNTTLLLASTVGPSTTDATRNHNIETFGTARQVANNSPYYDTYSAYFDGTGDYLTFGANQANLGLGTGDFTFEFWFYATTIPSTEVDFFESQTTGSFRILKRASSSGLSYDWYGGTAYLIKSDATITTNEWHHVAVSRTSGTVSVYYDGTRVINQADSTSGVTPTANYGVGGRASGANYFTGNISNMRLIKGTGLYSGTTITVTTIPLTAVANTQLLICNNNRFIDGSTNAFTITKAGDAKITAFEPFVDSNNSRFNSVYFPTKTDYLAVRTQPNLITFPGDFTFECWVYPTDTTLTSSWGIWDSRQSGATANPMIFLLTALASPVTGSWRLTYYNGTSYYGTGTVLWNQWTHVAWVRSGTTMTFYVNGVAGGTATISGTQTGAATTNPIYIGTKDNGLANYGTVGYIADFRITNGYARTITVPTAPYDIK
jgi:hypothetical protein